MGNKNNRCDEIKNLKANDNEEKMFSINIINKNNINITENIIEDYIKLSDSKPKTKRETKKILSGINNSKQLKSFENNLVKKSIKFYYNNEFKVIKYTGNVDEKSIKEILKSHFLIDEPIDSIFFADEDNDILILNSNVPSNLTVNLFIKKDLPPKNPSTALKIPKYKTQKPLVKFYWVIENDEMKEKYSDSIKQKYIYTISKTNRYSSINPSVISSISFTVGTYFFVIRVSHFEPYESLAIVEDEYPDYYNSSDYKGKTFVGYHYMNSGFKNNGTDIAIYIDMDKKKCRFYDYEKKTITLNEKINNDSVKLFAWIKGCCIGTIMTILNEGCIPIPDWVKP